MRLLQFGNDSEYAELEGHEFVNQFLAALPDNSVIIGTTNIHTHQAEALLEVVEGGEFDVFKGKDDQLS
jgi:hypothetical protein